MMCFRLDNRLVSWLHVLIVISFNNQHMYSLNHLLILRFSNLVLDVLVHIYNQSNYVSTVINH
jgi:hypothetical protein